ncbi:MAG: hypothetical protein AAB838_04405 [Patescibacteria group bacterium]
MENKILNKDYHLPQQAPCGLSTAVVSERAKGANKFIKHDPSQDRLYGMIKTREEKIK